jgi:hypothetical protein
MSASGPHSADQLIRELIATGRAASPDEIAEILERMATAPYNPHVVRVLGKATGATYQGHSLTARESSITYHLVKRVVIERQWAYGTTAADYLAHLQRAVRSAGARLVVYLRGAERVAASVTPTGDVLAPEQLGDRPENNLLVIYSATQSIIRTGYQFSRLSHTTIPPEALWLN